MAIGLLVIGLFLFCSVESITFRDINLLVVTDVHGWIGGHLHEDHVPFLDANYGDIASAVERIKDKAREQGKDCFFVNVGDHIEGSGLSDASMYTSGIHGSDLFPLIAEMPFDALTIGNHELYDDSTVAFMRDSGFIDSWKGNYVTSNSLITSTGDAIGGSKSTILVGPHTSMLVFGFLFHMQDSCETAIVENPKDTVKEDWFLNALADALEQKVDAVMVLSHMDLRDSTVRIISDAIREGMGEKLPLIFCTGHTHYRGFSKLDNFSAGFEAGHYLDTLGWISFDLPVQNETSVWFDYEFVDANRQALYNFTGTDKASFETELGNNISRAIEETVDKLGLLEVIGCPTKNYTRSASLKAPDSLYATYANFIVPSAVFDLPTGTGNLPYHYTSTGTLRYDVYRPTFYYNDVFAVAPFSNTFLYYPGLTGIEVTEIGKVLEGSSAFHKNPLKWVTFGLPEYVGGPFDAINDNATVYDLFFNDFDQPALTNAIASVRGGSQQAVLSSLVAWRSDKGGEDYVDTTTCWSVGSALLWPCHQEAGQGTRR